MKKIILSLFVLIAGIAHADPYDVTVRQRNAADTGYLDRFVSFPAGGVSCLFSLDGPTILPNCYTLGSGLSLASGVISVAAGGGQMQSDWNQANVASADYIKNKPSIPASQVSSDWSASSGVTQILNKPSLAAVATSGAYIDLSGRPALAAVATSGSYNDLSNKPTIPTITPFNFSQPAARSLSVNTSYQASDNTKAAIIVPSYACQNATTVLAASGCTIQVRMGTGTLTCSTGTVYYTQSLTVQLGVLITQNSTNPVQINLPIGASFILCPSSGTFTISAVEQSAG